MLDCKCNKLEVKMSIKQVVQLKQQNSKHVQLMKHIIILSLYNTADGRNPAPPKKPWNDGSPVHTNQQRFRMVSNWCKMDFVHPTNPISTKQLLPGPVWLWGPASCRFSGPPSRLEESTLVLYWIGGILGQVWTGYQHTNYGGKGKALAVRRVWCVPIRMVRCIRTF